MLGGSAGTAFGTGGATAGEAPTQGRPSLSIFFPCYNDAGTITGWDIFGLWWQLMIRRQAPRRTAYAGEESETHPITGR